MYTDITQLDIIRIIINGGGGFGHQRAGITLMEKLRELGFIGTFDIRYNDLLPEHCVNVEYSPHIGYVGRNLEQLIPGFKAKPISIDDEGMFIQHSSIGVTKITRLPAINLEAFTYKKPLPNVILTISAADDAPIRLQQAHRLSTFYHTQYYVHLNPTDWQHSGAAFITFGAEVKHLQTNLRLSCRRSYLKKHTAKEDLTLGEYHAITIDRKNFHTQLLYGLYANKEKFLQPEILGLKLVQALIMFSKETKKPVVLLLPERIALVLKFFLLASNDDWEKSLSKYLHAVDLTKDKLECHYQPGDVIIAYTNFLSQTVFEYLLLHGTTLPPVIEGCNTRELCESNGRAFIHSASLHDPFIEYSMSGVLQDMQELHKKASNCLKIGAPYNNELREYITMCLDLKSNIYTYHQERQQQFLARPDACETMINELKHWQENIPTSYKRVKSKI